MASGIPSIVSSSTGASELINSGVDGFVMPDYRDSKKLASMINDVISNPELANKIGLLARKKAEQFSWDKISEETLKVFENVSRNK
jgi:glycosyltransferase involved in cell wall biosynthesis